MVGPGITLRHIDRGNELYTRERKRTLSIGRLPSSDIALNDHSVSRRHAKLTCQLNEWTLTDLGSINGTYLNGKRVGRMGQALSEGDVLQFGNEVLIIEKLLHPDKVSENPIEENLASTANFCLSDSRVHYDLVAEKDLTKENNLNALVKIGRNLHQATSMKGFLEAILWEISEALEAEIGGLFLQDCESNLKLVASLSTFEDFDQSLLLSHPAALHAWIKGENILYNNSNTELNQVPSEEKKFPYSISLLIRHRKRKMGVLVLIRESLPFTGVDQSLLDSLALSISAGSDDMNFLLEKNQCHTENTLQMLTEIISKTPYQEAQQLVTCYAMQIADSMDLSENDRRILQMGAPVYDLGMICIDQSLISKPDKLTVNEYEQIKLHVLKGAELIEPFDSLKCIIPILRNHHERWDGKGYPDRLEGDGIPIPARIIAVADALQAMTTKRTYRPAFPLKAALFEIEQGSGHQFDPQCVKALLRDYSAVEQIHLQRKLLTATLPRENLAAIGPNVHAGL